MNKLSFVLTIGIILLVGLLIYYQFAGEIEFYGEEIKEIGGPPDNY